jgi:hypothetical protein
MNKFTINLVELLTGLNHNKAVKNQPSIKSNITKNYEKTPLHNILKNEVHPNNLNLLSFSKSLNLFKSLSVSNPNYLTTSKYYPIFMQNLLPTTSSTLQKNHNTFSNYNITGTELHYIQNSLNLSSNKYLSINLKELQLLSKQPNTPQLYNFNLEHNLNMSKQSRWFVKNSLLSNLIINNSHLITQSKKLIGTNISNQDFSKNNL